MAPSISEYCKSSPSRQPLSSSASRSASASCRLMPPSLVPISSQIFSGGRGGAAGSGDVAGRGAQGGGGGAGGRRGGGGGAGRKGAVRMRGDGGVRRAR